MGFWSSVGKIAGDIAGGIIENAKESSERLKAYKLEMLDKSDSELARIVSREKDSNKIKATAAFQELKNRGYEGDSLKDLIRRA